MYLFKPVSITMKHVTQKKQDFKDIFAILRTNNFHARRNAIKSFFAQKFKGLNNLKELDKTFKFLYLRK